MTRQEIISCITDIGYLVQQGHNTKYTKDNYPDIYVNVTIIHIDRSLYKISDLTYLNVNDLIYGYKDKSYNDLISALNKLEQKYGI